MVCQAGQEEWIMSNRTREINKITTTIIGISVKLMVYALIILLLYEAVARGYAFGHEIFFAEAVDEAPGQDMVVQIDSKESVSDAAQFLAHKGLIKSEFAFIFQSKFYDYDTIYPGTYTLNTSMTSKEILQLLNEKPETEDSAKPAQSGGAKAAEASFPTRRSSDLEKENGNSGASDQETSPAAAAASQDGAAAAAETDGEIPADAAPGSRSGEDALDSQEAQANEQTYEGEDQEMEGGWIEDAAEDGTQ